MRELQWRARWLIVDTLRRLDARGEALIVLLILAESALLYIFLGTLLPEIAPPHAPFPAWLIFALLLVGYALPHLLDVARVWSPRYETLLTLGIALSFLLAVKVAAFPQHPWLSTDWLRDTLNALILRPNEAARPVWGIVGLLVYTWWRGRSRAEPMLDTAYAMLRWGTLAAVAGVSLALMATPPDALIRERMPAAIIVFFAAALTAIGVARLRLEGIRTGGPLGPRWLVTFVLPIAAIVLVALLGTAALTRGVLDIVLLVLSPVFWVLGLLLRVIIVTVALLAFVLIMPILWLLERQGFDRFTAGERFPPLFTSFERFADFSRDTLDVADPLRYLLAGVVLFLLTSMLARYLYKRRRRWDERASERRGAAPIVPGGLGGLAAGLRRLFGREPDPLDRLRGDHRWRHTLAIRRTYARLLGWGARRGASRPASATPDEHEPTLARPRPDLREPIHTITATYDAARYGPSPATAEQAEAARRAWDAIRRQPHPPPPDRDQRG